MGRGTPSAEWTCNFFVLFRGLSFSPHPADTLKYRGKNIVEFRTPAQKDGLGAASRLQKNDSPICGAAILFEEEPSLTQLSIWLPSESSDLAQRIIAQAEREAEHFRD